MKRAPIPLPPGKDYRYVHDKIMSDIKTLRRKEKKKRDAEKPKKHPPKRNAVASQSKVADEVAPKKTKAAGKWKLKKPKKPKTPKTRSGGNTSGSKRMTAKK